MSCGDGATRSVHGQKSPRTAAPTDNAAHANPPHLRNRCRRRSPARHANHIHPNATTHKVGIQEIHCTKLFLSPTIRPISHTKNKLNHAVSMAMAAQSQRVRRGVDNGSSAVCTAASVMPKIPRVPLWQNALVGGMLKMEIGATCYFYRLANPS